MSKETSKALVIPNIVDDVELKTKPPITREQTLELMAKALHDEEKFKYAKAMESWQKLQNEYHALINKETEEAKQKFKNNICCATIQSKFEYGVVSVYANQSYTQSTAASDKYKEVQAARLLCVRQSYEQILQKLQFADEHQHFDVLKNEDAKSALIEAGKALLGRTCDPSAIECEGDTEDC